MSNIMAAIGLIQIKRFKILSNRRKVLAKFYFSKLKEHKKIQIFVKDYKNIVPHIYKAEVVLTTN